MAQEVIWQGSSSFQSGDTPWGLYDSDNEFTSSADKFADWCARRLGYPIMSVELQSGSFYACFEESVTEYSAQVNQFNIKDNLLTLRGQPTGSSNTVTHKNVTPTFGRAIKLANKVMEKNGRILVRKSGTEPKIRIMAESYNKNLILKCIKIIKRSIK